ncbi:odorant receptor 63a-like [Contarinia nasturtii]|uniref:odorant receptor 63a-like n=1 Tax=Contarinia nasturtii TaxID=265458 RepID=UPI0012D3F0DD|nr:odorant receptor 63a-like [Contarinia nasturtii]
MSPLESLRRILTWLCVYPGEGINSECRRIVFISCVFILNFIALVGSIAYFLRFLSTNLELSLYALYQITAMLPFDVTIVVAFSMQNKIECIFRKLEDICSEYGNGKLSGFLEHANNKSELFWRIFFKYVMIGYFISLTLEATIPVLSNWSTEESFNAEYLYNAYRLVLPWNQTTPLGYFGEMCFVQIFAQCYLIFNGAVIILFISLSWYHQAFYKMFYHSMQQFGDPERGQYDKEILCNLICFHTKIKDCFLISNQFYSLITFVQVLFTIFSLACGIFQFDLHMIRSDYIGSVFFLVESIACLSIVFCFCYNGQITSECFGRLSDCFYHNNWPNAPIELQKYIKIMIMNAQTPIYYQGCGIVVMNLETFRKTLRNVYTYVMLFKTMTPN